MKKSTISNEALAVLSRGSVEVFQHGDPFPMLFRLPEGQLDRKLYLEVNKVLETFGGKWQSKAKGHIFEKEDPGQKIQDAVMTGEFVRLDKNGYFPTPKELAFELVGMLEDEYTEDQFILEPSVGDGNLAYAICGSQFLGNPVIVGVEPNRELLDKAMERVATIGGRMTGVNSTFEEFMAIKQTDIFDAVVMNPPFENGQDAKHIRMAVSLLKPGGELVAIAGYGVKFRQDGSYKALRCVLFGTDEAVPSQVDRYICGDATMIDNEEGAFKSSGTNVRTVRIHYRKPL